MTNKSLTAGRPPRRKRRRLEIAVAAVGAVVIGWLVYITVNILNPAQGDLQDRSDAVISLAPQAFRLPLAEQLVSDGVADTLVISYFDHDPLNSDPVDALDGLPLSEFCDAEAPYEIVCFTPKENATIGEAYALAEMANERSWMSLTVVTDATHTFRTRFILDRCLGDDADINVVVADKDLSAADIAWHVVYENAAFIKAAWQVTVRC